MNWKIRAVSGGGKQKFENSAVILSGCKVIEVDGNPVVEADFDDPFVASVFDQRIEARATAARLDGRREASAELTKKHAAELEQQKAFRTSLTASLKQAQIAARIWMLAFAATVVAAIAMEVAR